MTNTSTSLYAMWFEALPAIFAAMQPLRASAPDSSSHSTAGQGRDPASAAKGTWFAFVQEAPALTQGILTQLYNSWAPLLSTQGSALEGSQEASRLLEKSFRDFLQAILAFDGPSRFTLPSASLEELTASVNPLLVGADRTFGAFSEAFGVKSLRDAHQGLIAVMTAEADRRAAQAAYLGILSKAWALGVQGLLEKLETMRDKGERVTSFLELVSLWIREIDQAGHVAMQSEAGLAATAAAVRATNRQRAELQRLVALVSLALNVPTRAEVDDGFREIQELKREIRRLKRNSVQIPTGIAPEKVVTQNRINKRQAAASSNGHGASAKRSRSTTAKGVRS